MYRARDGLVSPLLRSCIFPVSFPFLSSCRILQRFQRHAIWHDDFIVRRQWNLYSKWINGWNIAISVKWTALRHALFLGEYSWNEYSSIASFQIFCRNCFINYTHKTNILIIIFQNTINKSFLFLLLFCSRIRNSFENRTKRFLIKLKIKKKKKREKSWKLSLPLSTHFIP